MIKRHHLLSISSIVAWGLLTKNELSALLMGLAILILGHTKLRWKILEHQYHQAADLTSLGFATVSTYMFIIHGHEAIYKILQVAPFIGFPLLLFQIGGIDDDIPLSAFYYKLRKSSNLEEGVDITPHYFLCTLFAITTANNSSESLFLVVTLFIIYLLYLRVANFSTTVFVCFLTTGVFLSIVLINSFLPAYDSLLNELSKRITIKRWKSFDQNSFITSIGAISKDKQSDKIRLRVEKNSLMKRHAPIYLIQSTFDQYFLTGTWQSNVQKYQQLDKERESNRWNTQLLLPTEENSGSELDITIKTQKELFLMPTTLQTIAINSKDLIELSMNGYYNLRGEARPGYVRYSTLEGDFRNEASTFLDLTVPQPYVDLLAKTLKIIGVEQEMPVEEKVTKVRNFFSQNFNYYYPTEATYPPNTLSIFLRKSRKGHCEHFATATTLLLRQLGIPARYVVGYHVSEWSQFESQYIVRDRHAHAWTLAYIEGDWRRLDFTPPNWQLEEAEYFQNASFISDFTAYLSYSVHILKSTDMESYKNLLLLLIPPLIGILIFRLLRSPQVIRVETPPTSLQVPELFGLGISELVNDLEKRGIKRLRHETLGMLLRKSSEVGVPKELIENLISNYYELRFSQHTSEEKKKTLRAASLGVRKLL